MIEIGINNKHYRIPTTFNDLSLREYCRVFSNLEPTDGLEGRELFLANKRNEAAILSRLMLFTSDDGETRYESDDFAMELPLTLYSSLVEATKFIYGLQDVKHRGVVEVDGKTYKASKPEEMNLRQWIDIDVTSEEESPDKFIDILSMLLVEVGEDGEKKPYKGFDAEFAKRLGEVSCSEGLPIVYRFFLKGAVSSRLTRLYSMLTAVGRSLRDTQSS